MPEHPPSARLFFGLWPPSTVADRLGEIAREEAARRGGRPTRIDTLHLTLAFLGEVAIARLPELQAAAAGVVPIPFALEIDALGAWARPPLLWAGCRQTPPQLLKLVADLQAALQGAGFTVADAGRPFIPHVTLLRKLAHRPAAAPAWTGEALRWPVEDFVLVRSFLDARGSHYAPLWRSRQG